MIKKIVSIVSGLIIGVAGLNAQTYFQDNFDTETLNEIPSQWLNGPWSDAGTNYTTNEISYSGNNSLHAQSYSGSQKGIYVPNSVQAGELLLKLKIYLPDGGANGYMFGGFDYLGTSIQFKYSSNGYASINTWSSDGTKEDIGSFGIKQWLSIEVLYSTNSGKYTLSVNGSEIVSQTFTPNTNGGFGSDLSVRGDNNQGVRTVYIDDIVLSDASITCNDRYDEGIEAGKQICKSNPSACGISTGGTTVVSSKDDISIDITSSWQLVGTSGTIAVSDFSSFFDSDCVSKVYYFNGSWYPYVPGSSTSGLINIGPDQGFWIKGKKSCTLSNLRYTEEQCNLSYPSFSASDKAWCDAHYY